MNAFDDKYTRSARLRIGSMIRTACGAALASLLVAACTGGNLVPSPAVQMDLKTLDQMDQKIDRMIIVTVANPSESVPMLAGTTAGAYDGAPGYTAYGSARAMMTALTKDYGLREVTAWPIAPLQVHCAILEVTGKQTRAEVLAMLSHDKRVKLAQPLQVFHTQSSSSAPGYDGNYINLEQGLRDIDALKVQRVSQGNDILVAVIDTGIDVSHPDLAGRISFARDFVERDPVLFKQDKHGTAVAGVIAANPQNGRGIVGIAPGAKILALKACWQSPVSERDSSPSGAICNSLTLAQALTTAIKLHAQVINLSLSGPPDPLLTQLVNYALRHGSIVVGAVPPDGNLDAFPVGIPNVIPADVAGNAVRSDSVIYAPGHDVLTLTPGGHYDFLSGSSISTACVSGIAALMLAVDRHLDAEHVYAALKASSGAGPTRMVNACNALAAVSANSCAATGVAH